MSSRRPPMFGLSRVDHEGYGVGGCCELICRSGQWAGWTDSFRTRRQAVLEVRG